MTVGAMMNRWDAAAFANQVLPEIEVARQLGAVTHQEIADHLNARAIPTRKGGIWYRSTVGRVLTRSAWLDEQVMRLKAKGADPVPPAEPLPYVPRGVRRRIT